MRSDEVASRGAAAAIVLASAVVAILFSAFLSILVQNAVPRGSGPEYALFPYEGEVVAIGLIGGVLPLIAALAMLAASTGSRGDAEPPPPFRSPAYWLAVLAASVLITLFFTASQALYGGLGLPRLWAFWLLFAGCVAGVDYWLLRGRQLGAAWGAAECYVLGTLGAFGSDVIRTLTGLARAPGEAAVWGGGGLFDIVFWFGLYVSLSFLSLWGALALLTRARDALVHAGESGPRRP
jgi:hypothetical protein